MTSPLGGGSWQTGGRLVRIALLLPLVIAILLGTSIASVAATSTATGLRATDEAIPVNATGIHVVGLDQASGPVPG